MKLQWNSSASFRKRLRSLKSFAANCTTSTIMTLFQKQSIYKSFSLVEKPFSKTFLQLFHAQITENRWKLKNKSDCYRNHVHSPSGNEAKYHHQFHFTSSKDSFFYVETFKKLFVLQHVCHGKFCKVFGWSCTCCWSSRNCYFSFCVHFYCAMSRHTAQKKITEKGGSLGKYKKWLFSFAVSFCCARLERRNYSAVPFFHTKRSAVKLIP